MTRLRVVIVDDEPLALDRLSILLERDEAVSVVGRATGCRMGVTTIVRTQPDLVLLDIRMRDGTAFDLLEGLPAGVSPMVAFTTAFPRYAPQAFRIEALDYLLKPVDPEEMAAVLDRARRRMRLQSADERAIDLQRVVEQLRTEDVNDVPAFEREFWVRQRGTDHLRVTVAEIDWIGVEDDYACIHARGREHLLRLSLDKLMKSLDPNEFVRIHRSIVVRKDRVAKICRRSEDAREAVLRDGTRLPVGRVHARNLDLRHEAGSGRR